MKKTVIKILCLIMTLSLMCPQTILAGEAPARVFVSATETAAPGDEAVITIDSVINPGYLLQGVQFDFELSENFPEFKTAEIIRNTTGWENIGITKHNLLALGNVIEVKSQLTAKITFVIPDDAAPGTEYVLSLLNPFAANEARTFSVDINTDSVKIVVPGTPTSEDVQKTDEPEVEIKPEPKPSENTGGSTAEKESEKQPESEEVLPWKNPFSDVKEKDWFFDSVRYVFEQELMGGVGLDEFAPNVTLTRAMLVTILYRYDGSPASSTYGFSDVARNTWYTKSIDWAASVGIVNGVGDGMFAPESPVTREQMAVIFYNYTKHKELNIEGKKDLSSYTDSEKISTWASDALEWAVATGLMSGKGENMLDPSGNATRAETAAVIKRYAEKLTTNQKI